MTVMGAIGRSVEEIDGQGARLSQIGGHQGDRTGRHRDGVPCPRHLTSYLDSYSTVALPLVAPLFLE